MRLAATPDVTVLASISSALWYSNVSEMALINMVFPDTSLSLHHHMQQFRISSS